MAAQASICVQYTCSSCGKSVGSAQVAFESTDGFEQAVKDACPNGGIRDDKTKEVLCHQCHANRRPGSLLDTTGGY
jgi:hypothetical protein